MPDPYADEPERPRSTSGASSLSITKNVGPLPVWGWGAVLIAAVFLYRRISGGTGNPAQQAAAATGLSAPGYTPMSGGVYLLPGSSTPNSTGTTPTPAPSYLTTIYPVGGSGKAPAGAQCPPGYVLIQGPNGYTCATSDQAVSLGKFLASVPSAPR